MRILGISAYYHDSAAAIIEDGKVIAAAQEERFSRIKHDSAFPDQAVRFCMDSCDYTFDELDAVVFYDKPFLKFERILTNAFEQAPKGLIFFLRSIPIWLKEKLFLKKSIRDGLKRVNDGAELDWKQTQLLFSNHHLSHAASAFYCSPFEEAAVLTIDGVGEYATASIGVGKGKSLELLKEMHFPHSLGLLYSAFTYFLGFKVNNGEYKVMGLAPYSSPESPSVKNFYQKVKSDLCTIADDGSLVLNLDYFKFHYGLRMIKEDKWSNLLGVPKRDMDGPMERVHADLAQALQLVIEEVMIKMARHAKETTGARNLCLAGGVALNCVANGKLRELDLFDKIYVQPAAGDAGGALGAALAAYHLHFHADRTVIADYMSGGALGPEFSGDEILPVLRRASGIDFRVLSEDEITSRTAKAIVDHHVIGWFQERMEFGPRALGQRSILADATSAEMQSIVNLKIKKRESFRPFAPIMLEEEAGKYFECGEDSEYMLFVHRIKEDYRSPLPDEYFQSEMAEMLKVNRSVFPAITHTDYSARIQTVPSNSPKRIRRVLEHIKQLTGTGIAINTSFNVRGEPIVCAPQEALDCFLSTEMDILVMGNYWIEKTK